MAKKLLMLSQHGLREIRCNHWFRLDCKIEVLIGIPEGIDAKIAHGLRRSLGEVARNDVDSGSRPFVIRF